MILGINGIIAGKGELPMDTDAQAFITAASITDLNQQTAINKLVWDLKGANIWSKVKAIYPFVGGTATSHKFNLKDPRDLDAAFRLVFSGGWTHSSTGAKPNGTNAWADSKVSGSSMLQNSAHISVYLRTDVNGSFTDIGLDSNTSCISIWSRLSNLFYNQINNSLGNYLTSSNTNSLGLFISNRTASTVLNAWKNNIKVNTGTNASTAPSAKTIYLGALNDKSNVPLFYSSREQAFASIGDGLSDSEATALYNAVNAYQVALSRNV